ncbi:hypothetical protein ACWD6P_11175 [Streptomyces sp. NPDC002446]
MTRTHKAVVLAALTVAAATTAAAPAMADSHDRSGEISTFDHHAPITGHLLSPADLTAEDGHRP